MDLSHLKQFQGDGYIMCMMSGNKIDERQDEDTLN